MEKLIIKFNKEILPELKKSLKKGNVHETPRIEKVVVSAGLGAFKEDENTIKKMAADFANITGQTAKINKARKAVSAFKLKIGQSIGLTSTLRGEKMYDFIDMLVNIALPRVRDFRGIPATGFDGQGNFTLGLKDHSIFPAIRHDEKTVPFGFQINIKTTASNDEDAKALLVKLGFPFEKK